LSFSKIIKFAQIIFVRFVFCSKISLFVFIEQLLEQGARGRHERTANFCQGLLEEYDALWTFCDVENLQIPLTNNAAERALRHAVLMRRIQGGTQSEQGNRWVERILSVRETLRLQDRSVLDYLIRAATAEGVSSSV